MGSAKRRMILRRTWQTAGIVLLVSVAATLLWLRGALYNHLVRFPRETTALTAIRADRQPVATAMEWQEYRGVLHSHSKLSHDCEVPFEEILRVLKTTGRDFICLSDHCRDGRADFNSQWRGLHEGILFIPGFEMRDGFMPFGVAGDVVLSNTTDTATLAQQVINHGGVVFYAHPEEPRDWERPELTGMEIFNIHAELKRVGGLLPLLPELLVNQGRYPDQVFRTLCARPAANLQRWDEFNRHRHLTGIAGNDCHQNTGLRLIYTTNDTLLLQETSGKKAREYKLNAATRWLTRLCFGSLGPGRKLWQMQLDPYERMIQFVTTHALARELSESAVLQALRAGRVFVAFDSLADSRGFVWRATNGSARAVMGETIAWSPATRLHAAAPHRCRFTIVQDGKTVWQQQGRAIEWSPPGPGTYRVEAELDVSDHWTPWVYANPIWVQ
jgi:hypothetical protein